MEPIQPRFPRNFQRGILLYAPPIEGLDDYWLLWRLFYSNTHPNLSQLTCNQKQTLIAERTIESSPGGDNFIWEGQIQTGFYTLQLDAISPTQSTLSGQTTLGFAQPLNRIIIGLPYSAYPPIALA